jgi:hypothetical protein
VGAFVPPGVVLEVAGVSWQAVQDEYVSPLEAHRERAPKKRRCAHKHCLTRLSIYQDDRETLCFTHQPPDISHGAGPYLDTHKGPQPKPRATPDYRVCPECGRFMGKKGCRYCAATPHTEAI